MPAINALLPIVAASNSQKESTQNRADESRANADKNAASAVTKGLEQDAAAEKRMQQKRFLNAYEEGIQEQGRQQERRAQRVAASELEQRDDAAVFAASGSALPPAGESLPTSGMLGVSGSNASTASGDAAKPLPSQGPSGPSAANSSNLASTESPETALPNATESLSVEQQQQAAADAFRALVSTQNGEADGRVELQQATDQQGIVAAASLQAQEVASDLAPSDATKQDASAMPAQGEGVLAVQTQAGPSAATLAAALAGNDAVRLDGAEPEQAQLVRAWRGIDAQELRSAATITTTTQATRLDPVAASVPIALSGQIQQFAQSLRLASGQPDVVATATKATAERSTASAPQSSAELSPWRADSAAANAASSSGRAAAVSTPFAQAMQASNFGQPLGQAVGQNAWGESIAQRVSLMAGLKVSSAQIQLDPPELGAMTVKVSVNGDQASVSFHSPHAVVRDALELSFPRLQEMMGQQGLQLTDAQVSDNSFAGQGSGESSSERAGAARGETQGEGIGSATPQIVQVATGLIDFYA
jgi:flagellar hook-length control protein FliK